MSKQKAQGTTHESAIVRRLRAAGFAAKRIAEGGALDEGDIEAFLPERWVLEAKATSALNVQETLGKARRKAAAAGTPVPVAVIWKRLVRAPGKAVRQPVAGERVVVVLSLDDFLDLLTRKEAGMQEVVEDVAVARRCVACGTEVLETGICPNCAEEMLKEVRA